MEKYMSVDNISSYYEQVVQKKTNTAAVAKLTLLAMGIFTFVGICIILAITVAGWMLPVALISIGLGIYLIVRMIKTSRVEYEYTFVTGELRIARIKGKAKRRNITYFDVKNIDDMGRFIDPKTGKKNIDTKKYNLLLHAAADDYSVETYYFVIHDKVRRQPAILLMTPNEKTLSFVRPYLSVELKKKFLTLQQEDELIKKAAQMADSSEETEASSEKPETEKAETKETPKTEPPKQTPKKPENKPAASQQKGSGNKQSGNSKNSRSKNNNRKKSEKSKK